MKCTECGKEVKKYHITGIIDENEGATSWKAEYCPKCNSLYILGNAAKLLAYQPELKEFFNTCIESLTKLKA